MKLTGAEILCESLTRLGVREIFGYPGGAILPVYDALGKSKLHHVLVRHEQGATHMADGYARASGGIGVAMATSGPGATNSHRHTRNIRPRHLHAIYWRARAHPITKNKRNSTCRKCPQKSHRNE